MDVAGRGIRRRQPFDITCGSVSRMLHARLLNSNKHSPTHTRTHARTRTHTHTETHTHTHTYLFTYLQTSHLYLDGCCLCELITSSACQVCTKPDCHSKCRYVTRRPWSFCTDAVESFASWGSTGLLHPPTFVKICTSYILRSTSCTHTHTPLNLASSWSTRKLARDSGTLYDLSPGHPKGKLRAQAI